MPDTLWYRPQRPDFGPFFPMFAPSPRSSSVFLRSLVSGAFVAAALSTTACADDPGPGKLFEEDGVFELKRFALSGSGLEEVSGTKAKTFFLKFDNEARVVQTAMCSNDDIDDPTNGECNGFTDSQWFCQCFGYGFEEDQMAWQPFEAGGTPPVVKVGQTEVEEEDPTAGDTDTDGGSDGGEADGGDEPAPAGGIHQFTVAESAGEAATFDFTPLRRRLRLRRCRVQVRVPEARAVPVRRRARERRAPRLLTLHLNVRTGQRPRPSARFRRGGA